MNRKILLAGAAGAATLFVAGIVFYVLLLSDYFALDVAKNPPDFAYLVVGEIVLGMVLAWVCVNFGINTIAEGARTGALFGFLLSLGTGLLMYGSTTIAGLQYYLSDAVVWAIRYAAAGAVVGWTLGRMPNSPYDDS